MRLPLPIALLLASTLAATAAPPARKGFPWDSFQPRQLKHAVNLDDRTAEKFPQPDHLLVLTGDYVMSKTTVTYTGMSRPLPVDRRLVIERWALLKNFSPHYVHLYEEEFLFLEGSRKYWLAVQKPVALNLQRELKKAQSVEIYFLSGVGAERINRDWDWLLLLQEYQIPR